MAPCVFRGENQLCFYWRGDDPPNLFKDVEFMEETIVNHEAAGKGQFAVVMDSMHVKFAQHT